MPDNKLTNKTFWDEFWELEKGDYKIYEVKTIPFSDILNKYLKKTEGNKTALEIGCVPGNFLTYLCKTFNYFPNGIDYVKETNRITEGTLLKNGLDKFKVYREDFTIWNPNEQFDLVSSFGFIEHFDNPEEIIEKHINLLKTNGKLIIEVPNFNPKNLRFFIAKTIDKKVLNAHNIQVMNLKFYKKLMKKFNLKIDFLDYVEKFEYHSNTKFNKAQKFIYLFFRGLRRLIALFPHNNKYFSSAILLIATKQP